MCIRDRKEKGYGRGLFLAHEILAITGIRIRETGRFGAGACLLYTSDAADDLLCVDVGGRRIIKKKKNLLIYSLHSSTYNAFQHQLV